MSARRVSTTSPLNQRILAALRDEGPMHSYQLADLLECNRKTLSTPDYLPLLHAADLIHIADWIRLPELRLEQGYGGGRGEPARIYAFGPGEDAPRPKPHTDAQNTKRQRKTNPARFTRYRVKRHGLKTVDPLLAALMGIRPAQQLEEATE